MTVKTLRGHEGTMMLAPDVPPFPNPGRPFTDDLDRCDALMGVAPRPRPAPPGRRPDLRREAVISAEGGAAPPRAPEADRFSLGPFVGCAFDYGRFGATVRLRRWAMPPPRFALDALDARAPLNAIDLAYAIVTRLTETRRSELRSPRRCRHLAYPRFMVMALLHRFTALSFPAIARALGRSDHSTAMNGVRRAAWLEDNDPVFAPLMGQARGEMAAALGRSPQRGRPA